MVTQLDGVMKMAKKSNLVFEECNNGVNEILGLVESW